MRSRAQVLFVILVALAPFAARAGDVTALLQQIQAQYGSAHDAKLTVTQERETARLDPAGQVLETRTLESTVSDICCNTGRQEFLETARANGNTIGIYRHREKRSLSYWPDRKVAIVDWEPPPDGPLAVLLVGTRLDSASAIVSRGTSCLQEILPDAAPREHAEMTSTAVGDQTHIVYERGEGEARVQVTLRIQPGPKPVLLGWETRDQHGRLMQTFAAYDHMLDAPLPLPSRVEQARYIYGADGAMVVHRRRLRIDRVEWAATDRQDMQVNIPPTCLLRDRTLGLSVNRERQDLLTVTDNWLSPPSGNALSAATDTGVESSASAAPRVTSHVPADRASGKAPQPARRSRLAWVGYACGLPVLVCVLGLAAYKTRNRRQHATATARDYGPP